MRYVIYCDESASKGRYYANFYGGALIKESRRQFVEQRLTGAKGRLQGEFKWTKIGEYNEDDYICFVDEIFDLVESGDIKLRIMFTQNINRIEHKKYEQDNSYFMLYYQFIKHAFGLRFCNPTRMQEISVAVYLDDAPDNKEKLERFRNYLSKLSQYAVLGTAKVTIRKEDITEINSRDHTIMQAVDVVLGSINFRLNDFHREIPPGKRRRAKRTRAKERVFCRISERIRQIYPNFNIGVSTARTPDRRAEWEHPYRHWCFVPAQSVRDIRYGKKKR